MDIMWNFLQDPLYSPCNRHCGRPGLAWHLKTQVWGLTPKLPHAAVPLVVNHELRELIALAAALGTVEQTDGWQAVAPQVFFFP